MTAAATIQRHKDKPLHDVNVTQLQKKLERVVRGEVRFDDTSRALYASDGSNYRQVPIGVVIPCDEDDVSAAMAACHEHHAPVLPRGAGTSLCGQSCNVAVVIDLTKHINTLLEVDPQEKTAWVHPGVVLDDLRDAAEQHHLTFAPDPSTHNRNTLGGMVGNNSCGPHSVMSGRTSDNIIVLDILTYDGERMTVGVTDQSEFDRIINQGGRRAEIYLALRKLRDKYSDDIRTRFPNIPRRVSGFNLPDLLEENNFHVAKALVGSEGTCCMVLRAKVQLVDSPPERALLALGYPDIYAAADHIPLVMDFGPTATEGVDDKLVHDMKTLGMNTDSINQLPEGRGWLLVEFGGETKKSAREKAQSLMERLAQEDDPPSMKQIAEPEMKEKIWAVRKSALGATAHIPHSDITWEGWEDSAVPPENLGNYLRGLRDLYERYDYQGDLYGHFGQGCVHTRINFDLVTHHGIEKYKKFMADATKLVLEHGGSISGEHGDGQSKAQFLNDMYGESIVAAFHEFKFIWDPQGKMNPGKVVYPYAIDENLRLGRDYNPPAQQTYFRYMRDEGNFSQAMLRCVGVGECRKHDGGIMCPSFMATGEEMHSTRGRARLLFEMLQGDIIKDGWRNRGVKEALDLCLSCKGCASECPVEVDMATYKAEFLAHHFKGRLHPLNDYAFGFIDRWLQIGSHMPRVANFLAQTSPFSRMIKSLGKIAAPRTLPHIPGESFKQWFFSKDRIPSATNPSKRVILWPDTFNNYLHPETARAAVDVLESLGYQVIVPQEHFCCGRPLYEFGMLGVARTRLQNILQRLAQPIREGIPMIVLEPSCASVFREEMNNLLAVNEDAKRLQQQTYLFSEFLQKFEPDIALTPLKKRALVHGHCHHKSILGMEAEFQLLKAMQLDLEVPDSGCCGMAGSFGFEKEKYEVSMRIGERVLLPAVRNAAADTLIVANGYSCREQISQTTKRRAMHLCEVLGMALRHS